MKNELFLILLLLTGSLSGQAQKRNDFAFVVTADMRNFTGDNAGYFRGACEAIKKHSDIAFIVSPGDIDPPDSVYFTIQKYIDPKTIWYPMVGNHEAETPSDMKWLREFNKNGDKLPYIVNKGPESCKETNYSFDYGKTHFVVLNQYATETCDNCTKGDMNDFLHTWLEADLKKNKLKTVIVFGHEPAYPLPDKDSERLRHENDCLNQYPENRDRFVRLLSESNVKAYIFGHTHNYSVKNIEKVWHIDVGHSRGSGDPGARSTYVLVRVSKGKVTYETYRMDSEKQYVLTDQQALN